MICFSTKAYAPVKQKSMIKYRSFKHFDKCKYEEDLSLAPFHVGNIFDDIDDSMWFCESLMLNVMNTHAPVKKGYYVINKPLI